MQVDADADEELHGAERKMKGAGERAELLRRQVEFGLERRGQHGRDSAEGLAHRKGGGQRQQHDPWLQPPRRGDVSSHESQG
jgi:hypothetical protein